MTDVRMQLQQPSHACIVLYDNDKRLLLLLRFKNDLTTFALWLLSFSFCCTLHFPQSSRSARGGANVETGATALR